ncbi:enoyl-CoA hydratase/isomerase family protein [Pseudonocardia sp. GCM10023141]|uniref:enoyl-CoA hydratase/isomerase family protein n=1 Tax=Pseudonocardia sp. GCM10023141 TaxID=3252653 RepID=UPI00362439FC
MTEYVVHERTGRVSRIRLERPAAANRIHSTMMGQLIDALDAATAAGSDIVVISGAGPDFSVGRDQHEVLPAGMSKLDNTALIVAANRSLAAFPGITLAVVQGRALGFGCGLALQCDLSIAADTAELGFDEIHHGTAPAFVMSYLEDYVGPRRALDLIVTGRALPAAEAERYGMVSRVVAADGLAAAAAEMVADLLRSPGELLARCKAYLRENRAVAPADRLDHAFATFARRMGAPAPA